MASPGPEGGHRPDVYIPSSAEGEPVPGAGKLLVAFEQAFARADFAKAIDIKARKLSPRRLVGLRAGRKTKVRLVGEDNQEARLVREERFSTQSVSYQLNRDASEHAPAAAITLRKGVMGLLAPNSDYLAELAEWVLHAHDAPLRRTHPGDGWYKAYPLPGPDAGK